MSMYLLPPNIVQQAGGVINASRSSLQLPTDAKLTYGATGSTVSVGVTTVSGSAVVTLTAPGDFQDGQWVFIPAAGPLTSFGQLTAPSVSIGGGPSGNATYGYQLSQIDAYLGLSAASVEVTITNANTELGGLGPDGSCEGYDLYSASWLDIYPPGNQSNMNNNNLSNTFVVWRTTVPASGSTLSTGFIGFYNVANTQFLDYGQAVKPLPPGIPATPPSAPTHQSLIAQVLAGGGTTSLTLSVVPQASTTSQLYHDDTAALQAALNGGGVLYLPTGTYNVSQMLTVNQPMHIYGEKQFSILNTQGSLFGGLNIASSNVTLERLYVNGNMLAGDLVFVGNDATSGSTSTLSDVNIRHVIASGSLGDAFHLSCASDTYWLQRVRLQHNLAVDAKYAYITVGNVQNCIIDANISDYSDFNYTGRGIALHNASPGYPRHIVVSNNVIRAGNHTAAIVLQGGGLSTITGNIFRVAGGIFGLAIFANGSGPETSGGFTVTGNYFEQTWAPSGVCFNINNPQGCTISNNIVYNFAYFLDGGYPAPGTPTSDLYDALGNNMIFSNNQIYGQQYSPNDPLSTAPLSFLFSNNGGINPAGYVLPTTANLGTGVNQNNYGGLPLSISQPVYGTASTASVTLNQGATLNSGGAIVVTQSGTYSIPTTHDSSGNPLTLSLSVAPNNYYQLVTLNSVLETATLSATPATGTAYSNFISVNQEVYLPVYASQAGVDGTVSVSIGPGASHLTPLFTRFVSGNTAAQAAETLNFRLPQGWNYQLQTNGVTLGSISLYGH